MKIGLIDVDNIGKHIDHVTFPNLALMKLSAWHKRQGDEVEWCNPLLHYDIVYMSKVFDFTPDFRTHLNADLIIKGGVGYGVVNDKVLDPLIEHIMPDYSLYEPHGIKDTAYGFMSRGCPRQCSFCNVSQHQGNRSVKVSNLSEFWNGQSNIVLLDPNITLCKDRDLIMKDLIESKAFIDFSQGVDIRAVDDSFIELLNKLKLKALSFAWDSFDMSIYEKLKEVRPKLRYKDDGVYRVYMLTNYDTTHEQDYQRVTMLRDIGYYPYVMIYDKWNAPKETRLLQRWVNNRQAFKAMTFDEHIKSGK